MTTPDALAAALDRLVLASFAAHHRGNERDVAELAAARAAVVACAVPALARVDALEAVAEAARAINPFGIVHDETYLSLHLRALAVLQCALEELYGEPEDAGAGVTK